MSYERQSSIFRIFSLAVLGAIFAAASFAQLTATGIHGVVRDPSGAVVPKASVKLTDVGTGIEKNTTSAQDGGFVFPNLQAGTYKVTVSAAGFQTSVLDSIAVDSGRVTDVPLTLAVGTSTQTVEVSSGVAQLETTTNEVGTTINNKNILNLPYSSLDSLSFALLQAGAPRRQRRQHL